MSVADIKKVYEKVLTEKQADFICLATGYDLVLGDWYDADFAPRLNASGIKVREILPENWQGSLTQSDLIITPDWAALVSFDPKNPMVVVIEEPELVKLLANLFEHEWQRGQK